MTKEKSLSERSLEAYRIMFQEAGDFVEGSVIYDLWKLLPKKETLLKGELNVMATDRSSTTHNIIIDCLELVALQNRFYLYWQFGKKNNVFLINVPQNSKGLEILSKLFNEIIDTFEKQVIEVITLGVKLCNDYLFSDYKFLDIVESLEKRDSYFSGCNFDFVTSEQEKYSLQLFNDYLGYDVLLGLLRKYDKKQFFELMKFKETYLKQLRKVAFGLNEYLAGLSQKEFDKIDRDKLFKERMDKKGLIYPL